MNNRSNNRYNKNKENIKEEPKIEYTSCYKVNRSDELLEFLLKKCNTSRNNVKHLLSNHQVVVNGKMVSQFNFPLAKEDEVKISKRPLVTNNPKEVKKERKKFYSIDIIYEDKDFIAIDKPQGLLSVENEKETECAYQYVAQYLEQKNKTLRPYVIHRIDKETSGVLVFAKSPVLQSMLRLRWNDFVKTREYIAVVEGKMEKKEDTIVSYLMENQYNLVYSTKDPSGQKAITNYKVIKENNNYSLLNVNIETGRKNQIRVHMQDLSHPIVGDEKYGHNLNPLKRLGLHASKLEFMHPITKQILTIEAKCPNIFNSLFSNSSNNYKK